MISWGTSHTSQQQTTPKLSSEAIHISVGKASVRYNDTETWSVSGLPPNTGYAVTVRWPNNAFLVGTGTADANGEAKGSFQIGTGIPSGERKLRVEIASDPDTRSETAFMLEQ